MLNQSPGPLWYALTVKPNHERAAAQALECKALEMFVPLYRSRRRWSDRIKELELPLFAGYVFCRFPGTERARMLATPGVTSVVGFGNQPAPVDDVEIRAVRTLVASRPAGEPLALPAGRGEGPHRGRSAVRGGGDSHPGEGRLARGGEHRIAAALGGGGGGARCRSRW